MTKVYLAVGHGIKPDGMYDPGAVSADGAWNEQTAGDIVVAEVARYLTACGVIVKEEAYDDDPNYIGSAKAANAWGADYAVAVHHDWSKAPTGGFGLWYSEAGKRLANAIQAAVGAAGFGLRPNAYRDDLTFLKATTMPAVIYEAGRIGQYTPDQLKRIGTAIGHGIANHVGAKWAGLVAPTPPAAESKSGLFSGVLKPDGTRDYMWGAPLTRGQADTLFARLIGMIKAGEL